MITVFIAFLLTFPILLPHITVAQPNSTQPAVCEYQEKRKSVPINPKTNKPYAPDERNQEPFDGGSISKDEIRQCLQAKTPLKNHHIVFDDYWKAWVSLTKETGDYAIPLLIEGGVIHANYDGEAKTGGIRFRKFRDPNVDNGSNLTEEERKAFRVEQKNEPIALIRSQIYWNEVFIDSAVIPLSEGSQNIADTPSVIFSAEADFSYSTFSAETYFNYSTFSAETYFNYSTFSAEADFSYSTFSAEAHFNGSTFSAEADFRYSTFSAETYFNGSTFSAEADFSRSTFSAEADFGYTRFKNNADFRGIIVDSEQLVFDNTTWEERIDLRGISVKNLKWDSTNNPSYVKGVVDLRDARIGLATVKEVRFQDLVDFSRMTVGQYGELIHGPPTKAQWERQQPVWFEWTNKVYAWVNQLHSRPLMHFENNTFENEADFLHIKLHGPVSFIRNRFRSTLDLTGTTFEAQNSGLPNSTEAKPHLCLSYNRITRLVFESKHLDRVKSVEVPECQNAANSVNPSDHINQTSEPLPSISKSLEKAFSDVNDRRGVNEAWYLTMVAERDQTDGNKNTIWSIIWAKISWLFGDVPSRYAVDVGRTVWVSSIIIIAFAGFYLLYFLFFDAAVERWHIVNKKAYTRPDKTRVVIIPASSERQRGFRLRLFESIHSKQKPHLREIQPFRDAIALSVRAFTNLGMGTEYPNERVLEWLTSVEWTLGIFMLIHFILAMKNNLPFILPFLGVVN